MNHHFAVIAVSDFAKDPQFLAVLGVLDLLFTCLSGRSLIFSSSLFASSAFRDRIQNCCNLVLRWESSKGFGTTRADGAGKARGTSFDEAAATGRF